LLPGRGGRPARKHAAGNVMSAGRFWGRSRELELKTNTQLTREIDRLTVELHSRLLDKPAR
jgi:hypothetical protein